MTTDNGSALVARLLYKPFGQVRYNTNNQKTETLRFTQGFTGQWWASGGGATLGLYDYGARWYDPSLARFIQADRVVPEPGNPQSLNRYAYANNSPIVYNDPSGHCPTCIGAMVGGVAGAGLYLWSESRQDGFNWRQDWRDLLVATGEGAVAGALIATPGGQAAGIGMAANLIGDHIENLVVGEDFSAAEHLVTGVSGAVEGAVGLRAVKSVGDAAKFLGLAGEEVIASKMLVQAGNAAVWGAAEGGVRAALDGKNAWAAAKSGAIQNGATEIFTFGALRSIELGRSSKAEQTFAELAHSTLPDTVITFGRSVKQGIDRQQAIIDARERQRSGR